MKPAKVAELGYGLSKARKVKTGGKGTGNVISSQGRVTVDAIKSNPNVFKGKSTDEIAQMLRDNGYDIVIEKSKRSSSGAEIIKINNLGSGRNITQVQVSPGGGRHGNNPYVKISTSDQGIIKVVMEVQIII
ncbi:hypothetical protein P8825_13480 [Shouchella clausii]|uniref:Uncharacterized protein n=2 Tax=Shouchella clausii TaxID=79880 RepID=A0A268S639_SHOCL|nr:hypothetical protein [Shouchella clausii]PAD42698.1 hypothetical protein CHH54_10930 [Bacillus sp. 7520-S]MEB5480582.1 hypothetical protein [Shouchella clausii]PAD12501.1 hypothetical protein CHH74_15685 [Shouchella clausii]PAE98232.1 hypothetical protein CHH71_05515 [Shouchella clausii]PAF27995.1 hypothetical protein CHH61_00460 [Shouchella clausii]